MDPSGRQPSSILSCCILTDITKKRLDFCGGGIFQTLWLGPRGERRFTRGSRGCLQDGAYLWESASRFQPPENAGGLELAGASKEEKCDRKIVPEVVKRDGLSLAYAPSELRGGRESHRTGTNWAPLRTS